MRSDMQVGDFHPSDFARSWAERLILCGFELYACCFLPFKLDYFLRAVFLRDGNFVDGEFLALRDFHADIAISFIGFHVCDGRVRLVFVERRLAEVAVLLYLRIDAVQLWRIDRRDDRRCAFGVLRDGKLLSLAECGFKRGLLR